MYLDLLASGLSSGGDGNTRGHLTGEVAPFKCLGIFRISGVVKSFKYFGYLEWSTRSDVRDIWSGQISRENEYCLDKLTLLKKHVIYTLCCMTFIICSGK